MKREINTKIKVFPQLYVGRKAQYEYDRATKTRTQKVDLGFAMPLEDNAAFRKRKSTVDRWAIPHAEWDHTTRKSIPVKALEPLIIDNSARSGFKITDDVRRIYWGGGNVVWRVEDPLGFELEISSQNLMAIIQTVGIIAGGLIPGRCVWARDGANNVLLHESTEEFGAAYKVGKTTSTKGTKLSPELIGSKVSFSSGYSGIYLGAGSTFCWNSYDTHIKFKEHYFHFFKNLADDEIVLYRDPKPLLIEDGIELTDAKALKLLNSPWRSFSTAGTSSYGNRYTAVNRAKKCKSMSLQLLPVSIDTVAKALELDLSWYTCAISRKSNSLYLGIDKLLDVKCVLGGAKSDSSWGYSVPRDTQQRLTLNFPCVELDDATHRVEPTGSTVQVKIDVPVANNTADNREARRRLLLDVLGHFQSFVEVVPVAVY